MTLSLITARAVRTVTVNNTTLFAVAAELLGDALQWTRIARLNGLTDPFIVGDMELKIPTVEPSYDADGVLQ